MSTQIETPVGELVEVLRDCLAAHHKLIQLEITKREAILARDGERLKQAAQDQAGELHHIDLLDSRRDRLARNIMHRDRDIRLAHIIESEAVSAPEKKELGRYHNALQAALSELRRLSEINTRMLSDSRDMFKAMLASLTGRHPHAERAQARPVLVDANC